MYISSILFYLTWPALILLTYWLVTKFLKIYEDRSEKLEKGE